MDKRCCQALSEVREGIATYSVLEKVGVEVLVETVGKLCRGFGPHHLIGEGHLDVRSQLHFRLSRQCHLHYLKLLIIL